MRRLVYTMRFEGQAAPAGPDGLVLIVTATSPGWRLVSVIGPEGFDDVLEASFGREVALATEMTMTGATGFQQVGAIGFGTEHHLRFASIGSGYLKQRRDSGLRHGAVTLQIGGGDGRFAGASGLITSNFIVDIDLVITDHHLGVLFLK